MKGYSFNELVKLAEAALSRVDGGTIEKSIRVNGCVFPYIPLPTVAADVTSEGLYVSETGSSDTGDYPKMASILGVRAGSAVARHFQQMVGHDGTTFKIRAAHSGSPDPSAWHPWYRVYTEAWKPTAADCGALSLTGGEVTGTVRVKNATPRFELLDTDYPDQTWRVELINGNYAVSAVGKGTWFQCMADTGDAQFYRNLRARSFIATTATGLVTGVTTDGSNTTVKSESGYTMLAKENNSETKANEFIAISPNSVLQFRQDDGTGTKKHSDWRVYHQGYKPTAADCGALALTGGKVTGTIEIESTTPVLRLRETDNVNTPYMLVVDGGNIRLNVRTTSALDEDIVWKWDDTGKSLYTPGKLYGKGGVYDGTARVYSSNNIPTAATLQCISTDKLATGSSYANLLRKLVEVNGSGVIEAGRMIDMHAIDSTADCDVRLECTVADGVRKFFIHANEAYVSGSWKIYHQGNKPTPDDVDAVSKSKGGAYAGAVVFPATQGCRSAQQSDGSWAAMSAESGYVLLWKKNGSSTVGDEFVGIKSSQLLFRKDKGLGDKSVQDCTVYHSGNTHKHTAAEAMSDIISSGTGGLGQVGTTAILFNEHYGNSNIVPGQQLAGSDLLYSNLTGSIRGVAPAGTWKCLGHCGSIYTTIPERTALWIRIA